MTTATQLRMSAFPVGPGELLLVFWFVASFLLLAAANSITADRRSGIMPIVFAFWTAGFALMSFGAFHALIAGKMQATAAAHDVVAFLFSAVISIQMARAFGRNALAAHSIATYLPIMAALLLLVLLAVAFAIRQIGPVNFWYAGIRFTAMAENPNQLALLLVALPFMALQVRADSSSARKRNIEALAAIALVVVGIATLSDALVIAWSATALLIGSLGWFKSVFGKHARGRTILIYGILGPLLGIAVLLPFLGSIANALVDAISGVYSDGAQGSVRLRIWGHGIEAMLQSPLYGLGPGPHSGLNFPNEGFEAHNTLVDWGASSGLLGLLLYATIFTVVALAAVRAKKVYLLGGLIALFIFSLFHYVLRQPLFWGYLVLALAYSRSFLIGHPPNKTVVN